MEEEPGKKRKGQCRSQEAKVRRAAKKSERKRSKRQEQAFRDQSRDAAIKGRCSGRWFAPGAEGQRETTVSCKK